MSFWGKKLILLTFCALFAGAAFGQDWPVPAPTPDTLVPCNTSGCTSSEKDKKLWPYSSPLTKFVGRYADNTTQQWEFVPTGTARTRQIWFAPRNNRIYMILGGILAAYDMDTFFTRLAGGEAMTGINGLTGIKAGSGHEKVLNADRMFYPFQGWSEGFSGGDGERRTYRIDWDDRGNLYIPADAIGWGVVKDDLGKGGGQMTSLFREGTATNRVLSVKTSDGRYYTYVLYYSDSVLARSQKVMITDDVGHPDTFRTDNVSDIDPKKWTGLPIFKEFAKNSDGTRIAVLDNDGIRIYTNDAIVRVGAPIVQFRGSFGNIAGDGTNFFAATLDSAAHPVIHVMSPDTAGSYTKTTHTLSAVGINTGVASSVSVFTNPDAGGYLTLLGFETAYNGYNVRLYKMTSLVPTEVALNGYVARHYDRGAVQTGYVTPGKYIDLLEAASVHVLKRGSKYYLMLSAHAVGDVYEIKGADFLTAKLKSFGKTVNVNSKAAPNAGPFYGDEIKFTTDFSGATPPSVTWNFGDNIQQTVTPGTTGAPDVTHQYGGLSVVQLPATMNVTATSAADSSMTHSINMTLAKPAVRVGVANTSILFTQGTTDLTLPIVTSDLFYDGSDGAVEGHYSEWKLATDTASTKAAPNQTFGVGGLGDRELTFTGHYGPYTANFTNTADAPLSITPIKYKVRAFVPVVNGPLASGGNVVFKSATRVTTNTAHLLNGGATVVVYKWEILNAAGAPVGTAVTGSAAISAIPDFSLPRSSFAGAQNWKARLSLTTVDNTTETALSIALNGPTPAAIVPIGCTNIGSPCSFTVSTSVPANDPSTWTYAWSATGIATLPGGSSATYAPTFAVAGAYSITVLVSNALGDAPALALPVSLGQPLCSSSPTTANTAITCKGRTSGCVAGFSNCTAGETIDFWINTQGWTASDCDNFTWSWGDGTAPSTTQGPSHAYTSAGSYTVTLIVDGGLSDAQVSKVVTVGNTGGGGGNGNGGGGNGNGGGGGGGGTGACTILAPPINVFATWTGATSGCNALTNCSTGEAIGFKMGANGYNYDCGPHSFTYHFGDGSADQTTFSPTQVVNHTYTTAGPFTLEVLITNGSSSATASHTVKVVAGSGGGGGNGNGGGGNGNGGGGSGTGCSDMNPPTNVYMNYSGPTSGCTSVVGTCAASENINFSLGVQGYNLDCTTHTYEWDFGDGTPKSTDKNATHAYTQGGDYPVSLKINRLDGKTATISRTVKVAGGNSCPNMVAGENIIVVFFGAKSKCTLGGGTCQEDESLSFGLIGGYNFSCSTHTLEWDFGDGTPKGNGQSPSHAYDKGGDYHGTVKIKNSKQEISVPFDIKIPVTPTRTRSARH